MVSKLETTAHLALLFPSKTKLLPSVYQISLGLVRGSSDSPSWGFLSGGLLESETVSHELSAKLVFAVPVSSTLGFLSRPLHCVFFAFSFHHGSFCRVGLLLYLVSASWGLSWGCFSQVMSEKWHHRCQGSVQFPRFCLVTAKIWSDGHGPVLQLSVTAQFYLVSKGKYIL